MDLTELAKHRWVNKWSVNKLAKHFERSPETVQMHLCTLRKSGDWQGYAFSKEELRIILKNVNIVFRGYN